MELTAKQLCECYTKQPRTKEFMDNWIKSCVNEKRTTSNRIDAFGLIPAMLQYYPDGKYHPIDMHTISKETQDTIMSNLLRIINKQIEAYKKHEHELPF